MAKKYTAGKYNSKKKKAKRRRLSYWSMRDILTMFLFIMFGIMMSFVVVLGVTDQGPNITFEEYEKRELALDDSTENVIYVEADKEEEKDTMATEHPEATVTESTMAAMTAQAGQSPSDSEDGTAGEDEEDPYDLTDRVEIPDVSHPYYIKVNRARNCVTVYTMNKKGKYVVPVKAMVCSVGLNNNTPLGVFKTSTKYKWRALFGNVYGQYAYRIHNSILFHSVPYYSTNKDDLETEEYNKLGEAASLGCVRLACADAKWLLDNCPKGTTVEIYDDEEEAGPLGRPDPVIIDVESKNAGWDPTDPDKKNPWKKAGSKKDKEQSAKDETQKNSKEEMQTQAAPPVIDYSGALETVVSVDNNTENVVCENAMMMAQLLISNGVIAIDAAGTYEITPSINCLSSTRIYNQSGGGLEAVSVVVRVTAADKDGNEKQKDYTVIVKVVQ